MAALKEFMVEFFFMAAQKDLMVKFPAPGDQVCLSNKAVNTGQNLSHKSVYKIWTVVFSEWKGLK